MNADLLRSFEPIRSYYLRCYEKSLSAALVDLDKVVVELLLELPKPDEAEPLFKTTRVDIFGTKPDGGHHVREVNVSPRTAGAGLPGFSVPILLEPCVWNGLEIEVEGSSPPADLPGWVARWLDLEDRTFTEALAFQSVIHSFLRPRETPGGYELAFDMGSAPTEALADLLDIVTRDAERIRLGSFTYCEGEDDKPDRHASLGAPGDGP